MKSKFKVGDRVRQVEDDMWRGIEGVYDGRRSDGSNINEGIEWDYFIPDAGQTYSNGDPCTFAGRLCGMGVDSFELIQTPESKALSLLRKIVDHGGYGAIGVEAMAILAEMEPSDGDKEEAMLLCHRAEVHQQAKLDTVIAAIKRGRELERGE